VNNRGTHFAVYLPAYLDAFRHLKISRFFDTTIACLLRRSNSKLYVISLDVLQSIYTFVNLHYIKLLVNLHYIKLLVNLHYVKLLIQMLVERRTMNVTGIPTYHVAESSKPDVEILMFDATK
jgi:hypothetical protein